MRNIADSKIEKASFCKSILTELNIVWVRNGNRNRNFYKVISGTGTAMYHFSSTTMHKSL